MSGIAVSGSMMGLATGLFWANRGFLVLSTTNDSNRNYYYGLESFFLTFTSVIVPMGIGLFIAGTTRNRWLNGNPNNAYRIISICVIVLTVLASIVLHFGRFENPPLTKFVFFRFDPLWHKMLVLAALKGLVQGYIVTAPAMLIMMLVGQEGTLGTIQAVGGIVSSFFLYGIGRVAKPNHRVIVFSIGLAVVLHWNSCQRRPLQCKRRHHFHGMSHFGEAHSRFGLLPHSISCHGNRLARGRSKSVRVHTQSRMRAIRRSSVGMWFVPRSGNLGFGYRRLEIRIANRGGPSTRFHLDRVGNSRSCGTDPKEFPRGASSK